MLGTLFGVSILLVITHAVAIAAGGTVLRPMLAKLPIVGKYFV